MRRLFRWLVRLLKGLLVAILCLVVAATAFLFLAPVFGGRPDAQSQARVQASSNHDGTRFVNLTPTQVSTPDPEADVGISNMLFPPKGKNPRSALPAVAFDATTFKAGDMVWFGHSTLLMNVDGLLVLTDPVFYNASPIPYTIRPFPMTVRHDIGTLPDIDVVLISHDHYDHLDYKAVRELDVRTRHFLVPLGVKAHLQRWGIADEKITELDWYEDKTVSSLTLTLTPARHFSGRGLRDRQKTLWGAWVVQSADTSLFFSGDGGYSEEFKTIGTRYGPFDMAFMENGAYNTQWAQIHMMPEESVQASVDLQAKVFFPIHWGKFDLAMHRWTDPVERAVSAAREHSIAVAMPKIGEVFTSRDYPTESWWQDAGK